MKSEYQNQVVFRLRKLREKYGYSQSKVGLILGISDGQVGNIETPNQPHKYTLPQIETLCKTFDVPVESVFFGEKENYHHMPVSEVIHQIVKYLS